MSTTPTLGELVAAYLASRGARSPYDLTRDPVLAFPGIPNLAAGDVIVPPVLPPQGAAGAGLTGTAARPASAPPGIGLSGEGGSEAGVGGEAGGMGAREGPGYGSMGGPTETALGVAAALAGLMGLGPLGLGLGAAALASKLSPAFQANPMAGIPTEAAIRLARDYDPNLASRLSAERQSAIDAARAVASENPETSLAGWFGGSTTPGPREGQFGGPTGSLEGGFQGISESRGEAGAPGPGEGIGQSGTTSDVGPGEGVGQSGTGGDAGDGDSEARGGVVKARKATTKTFGEAGAETGVFVPEWMKRPGIQGKERSIIAALEALLKQLRASAGRAKEKR